MKKVPFTSCVLEAREEKRMISMFFIIFDHAQACATMRNHAFAGQNTQQVYYQWVNITPS